MTQVRNPISESVDPILQIQDSTSKHQTSKSGARDSKAELQHPELSNPELQFQSSMYEAQNPKRKAHCLKSKITAQSSEIKLRSPKSKVHSPSFEPCNPKIKAKRASREPSSKSNDPCPNLALQNPRTHVSTITKDDPSTGNHGPPMETLASLLSTHGRVHAAILLIHC